MIKKKKERKYCRAKTQKKKKKTYNGEKKNRDEIEEKRWSKGWAVLMADGYREESGLEREKEEEKKNFRKKEKRWFEG